MSINLLRIFVTAARRLAARTQLQVASDCGMSRKELNAIETGTLLPARHRLVALSRILNVPVEFLECLAEMDSLGARVRRNRFLRP